ncbi:nucleotidyltransferase family protein [Endozoicomonas sp. Mp262]|uniref:nucleotidyltransferase family protein n=1 Tax=Endozoicomonas sp. Mp262 TaxID=2919499 RepID=UPI0021DB2B51
MMRDEVICKLRSILSELKQEYQVQALGVFGSVARNEAATGSDIDILVSFTGKPTYDSYMNLKFYLEDVFQTKIDLVTEAALDDRIRSYIEEDLIHVA